MDYIRSCYQTNMRFFADRPDILVPVRWYFCKPGAKEFKGLNSFRSTIWSPEVRNSEGVGEVGPPLRYDKGIPPPTAHGEKICGTPEEFADGLVYDPLPPVVYDFYVIPVCCHRGEFLGDGGPEIEDAIGGTGTAFWGGGGPEIEDLVEGFESGFMFAGGPEIEDLVEGNQDAGELAGGPEIEDLVEGAEAAAGGGPEIEDLIEGSIAGSGSFSFKELLHASLATLFGTDNLIPTTLVFDLERNVRKGKIKPSKTLRETVILRHSGKVENAGSWYSKPLQLSKKMKTPGFWVLTKESLKKWSLTLRTREMVIAQYLLNAENPSEVNLPLTLWRDGKGSGHFRKWPGTITINYG